MRKHLLLPRVRLREHRQRDIRRQLTWVGLYADLHAHGRVVRSFAYSQVHFDDEHESVYAIHRIELERAMCLFLNPILKSIARHRRKHGRLLRH
jgi:hypothetical protein